MGIRIFGTGSYLPEKVVTNDDLAKTLNKYKKEGLVKGRISFEDGGWIWWVEIGHLRQGIIKLYHRFKS